jgi:tetratricopeptide (TPR) repeat protein
LVRASAVQFIEQLALGTAGTGNADVQSQTSFGTGGTKAQGNRRVPARLTAAQVNALVGAASDPEAIVRAEAITALLAAGDRDRAVIPIIARLTDSSRVVRTKAAEALLALGVAVLPAAAGEALSRAQDEYAIALSSFPDAPSNYTELGWLEAERQRVGPAIAALDTAIRLDPKAARPLVIKGVLAAREGRFKDASDLWRKAKTLQPDYPNIDRLIEEAEKRKD